MPELLRLFSSKNTEIIIKYLKNAMKISKLIVPVVVLTATYNNQVEAGHCETLYQGFSNTCRGLLSPVERAVC